MSTCQSNSRATELLFAKQNSDQYLCKVCEKAGLKRVIKQIASKGTTNLVRHIEFVHGTDLWKEVQNASVNRNQKKLVDYLTSFQSITPQVRALHQYIEAVVFDGLPFTFVESWFVRKNFNISTMSRKSLVSICVLVYHNWLTGEISFIHKRSGADELED